MDLGYNSAFFFTMFLNVEQFVCWKCPATLQSSSVMTEVLHLKKWNCPLRGRCDSFPLRLEQSGQRVPAERESWAEESSGQFVSACRVCNRKQRRQWEKGKICWYMLQLVQVTFIYFTHSGHKPKLNNRHKLVYSKLLFLKETKLHFLLKN